MKILKFLFSTKTKAKSELRVINSHERASDPGAARLLNEQRVKEIKLYQAELARYRKTHATYAQSLPTKSQQEASRKLLRSQKRTESWSRYVDGLKKSLNPPISELQAAGLIPKRDETKKAEKSKRGEMNLMKSLKQSVLMKRKYLNYLSGQIIPNLITGENLDAKIQEAVDRENGPVSYNQAAEDVVEMEEAVKRKLREIRVPLEM